MATLVATATLGGAMMMTATTANAAGGNVGQSLDGQVCDGLDSGKIDTPNSPSQVTVTAPDGMLIDGYCVKAGSALQGDGPVYVDVAPPQKTVTFSYPGGKNISHYSVSYTEAPPNSETTECENVTVTIRETEQVPVTETVTATVKTTKTVTATDTVTEPGATETVTETAPGETQTVTETAPAQTVTQTLVNTITLPPVTETVTEPGATETVTLPGTTTTVTNTVTNTVSVAPSDATSVPAETTEVTVTAPGDDVTVKGEQAHQQEVPSQVAAGAAGSDTPASPVPGGNTTLALLALLVATLGAGLVGASVASKRQH